MRRARGRPSIGPHLRLGGRERRLLAVALIATLPTLAPTGGEVEGHLAEQVEVRGNTFTSAVEFDANGGE